MVLGFGFQNSKGEGEDYKQILFKINFDLMYYVHVDHETREKIIIHLS